MNIQLKILIIVIVFTVPILLYYLINQHKLGSQQFIFTPTPTAITVKDFPHSFSNPSAGFTVAYPANFSLQPNIESTDQTTTFTYGVNGKKYAFQVIPGGTAGTQAYSQKVDKIVNKVIYIDSIQFMQQIWYYQNNPFFVSAIPNEEGVSPISFQMQLPSENSDQYLDLFTKIISNSQLPQQQNLPTPMISLQAEGTTPITSGY